MRARGQTRRPFGPAPSRPSWVRRRRPSRSLGQSIHARLVEDDFRAGTPPPPAERSATRSRYSASPVPSGSAISIWLRCLRNGKLFAPCIETVSTGVVVREDRRRAVALMDIEVDHRGAAAAVRADGDGDIVEHAEARRPRRGRHGGCRRRGFRRSRVASASARGARACRRPTRASGEPALRPGEADAAHHPGITEPSRRRRRTPGRAPARWSRGSASGAGSRR